MDSKLWILKTLNARMNQWAQINTWVTSKIICCLYNCCWNPSPVLLFNRRILHCICCALIVVITNIICRSGHSFVSGMGRDVSSSYEREEWWQRQVSEAWSGVCVTRTLQNIHSSPQVKQANKLLTCRAASVQNECVKSSAAATLALRAAPPICWLVSRDLTLVIFPQKRNIKILRSTSHRVAARYMVHLKTFVE